MLWGVLWVGIYGVLKELITRELGKGSRWGKGLCYIFCFCFSLGQRISTVYLAIKKNGLETLGVMLASLYKVLWSNSVFTSSQSVLGIVTASRTLWGPVLPLWLSFFSLSMRGCESFPESIPGVSLCLTLPSCALRAFYSSHCSANVTIVSLLGMAQDEKSDFPMGRREHSPSSYMACWLPGSAVALSVDSSRMSHCGKWGLDSGVAWQCAMRAPTANSSGCVWWLL